MHEINDCAFPLVEQIIYTSNLKVAINEVDFTFLVGAMPRSPGQTRHDCLKENGVVLRDIGNAINDHAKRENKVLVVGNPANTNALVC